MSVASPVPPLPTATVPVTFAAVPVVLAALFGMSAETRARNVGAAAVPVVGPAQTVLAVSVERPIASVPDVVMGEPLMVNPVGTVFRYARDRACAGAASCSRSSKSKPPCACLHAATRREAAV